MCTDCKLRYPKYFHLHTWQSLRKLDSKKLIGDKEYYRDAQEEICKKYNVFIPLWTSKRQRKIYSVTKWLYRTHRALKWLKKKLNENHEKNQNRKTSKKNSIWKSFTMSEKDYKSITGKTTDQDLSFITGKRKKQDYSALTGRSNRDYSGLVGKRKNNSLSLGKQDYSSLLGKRKKIRL